MLRMLSRLRTIGAAGLVFLALAPAARAWTWPASGPVLAPFRYGTDPYAAGQHRGMDVGGDAGTAVVAPQAGMVSFAGSVPTNGLSVTIETADGFSITLVHLGSIAVTRGGHVAEGQPVGTIGPSGTAEQEAPYVHLGVRTSSDPNGYLDPLLFLPARAAQSADQAPSPAQTAPPPAPKPQTAAAPAPAASAPPPPASPSPAPAPESAPEVPAAPDPVPVDAAPTTETSPEPLSADPTVQAGSDADRLTGVNIAGHPRRTSVAPSVTRLRTVPIRRLPTRARRRVESVVARAHAVAPATRTRSEPVRAARVTAALALAAPKAGPVDPEPTAADVRRQTSAAGALPLAALESDPRPADRVVAPTSSVVAAERHAREFSTSALWLPPSALAGLGAVLAVVVRRRRRPGPAVGDVAGRCLSSLEMRFYLTTPIYYVNSTPHIGHAYTTIAADIVVRHHRQRGDETWFLTGRGRACGQGRAGRGGAGARAPGVHGSDRRRVAGGARRVNATNDFFIRTSDEGHKAFVQEFLQRIRDNGRDDIYQDVYAGLYCVGCEAFKTEDELVDGKCPDHGTVPEWIEETELVLPPVGVPGRLLAIYDEQLDFVLPQFRYNEARSFIAGGLRRFLDQPRRPRPGVCRSRGIRSRSRTSGPMRSSTT